MKLPEFNSIEEVKAFISSTDNTRVGAINFVDESGDFHQLPMDKFIEKVGLDEAARFIFEGAQNNTMKQVAASREEFIKIFEKFEKDPDSLTDEEKTLLFFLLENIAGDENISNSNIILAIILKTFWEFGGEITSNYSGLLGILLTLMEYSFTLSSDLATCVGNRSIYNEIVKNVTDQIIIPEGIDETSLFIGLMHIIGERYINSDLTRNMIPDYHSLADYLGLDMEFIFEEEYEDTIPKHVEEYKKEILPDVKNFLEIEHKTNSSNSSDTPKNNIVNLNIRKSLKGDKNKRNS
jgi:hypothetical protein